MFLQDLVNQLRGNQFKFEEGEEKYSLERTKSKYSWWKKKNSSRKKSPQLYLTK